MVTAKWPLYLEQGGSMPQTLTCRLVLNEMVIVSQSIESVNSPDPALDLAATVLSSAEMPGYIRGLITPWQFQVSIWKKGHQEV